MLPSIFSPFTDCPVYWPMGWCRHVQMSSLFNMRVLEECEQVKTKILISLTSYFKNASIPHPSQRLFRHYPFQLCYSQEYHQQRQNKQIPAPSELLKYLWTCKSEQHEGPAGKPKWETRHSTVLILVVLLHPNFSLLYMLF